MSELRTRTRKPFWMSLLVLVALNVTSPVAFSKPLSRSNQALAGTSSLTAKSSYSATWILHNLPPFGTRHETFDETLIDSLEIVICLKDANGSCDLVDRLTSETGAIRLSGGDDNGFYRMDWAAPSWLVGADLEIRLAVAGLVLDTFDYEPETAGPRSFHIAINDHPLVRARVLHSQGADAFQLAEVLVDEFALGSLETVNVLAGEGFAAFEIGEVLLRIFGESPEDAAWLMRAANLEAGDVGTALRDVYAQQVFDVSWTLSEVGYACMEIDRAIRDLFGADPQRNADALAAIDCAPDPVTCALPDEDAPEEIRVRKSLVDSLAGVVELRLPGGDEPRGFDDTLLDSLRITVAEIEPDGSLSTDHEIIGVDSGSIRLQDNFYHFIWRPDPSLFRKSVRVTFGVPGLDLTFTEITITTRRAFSFKFRVDNHPVIRARVLREAGRSAVEIVARLVDEFRLDGGSVAKILLEEDFSILEIGAGLRDGLPAAAEAVTEALHSGELSATLALEVLGGVFGLSAEDAVPIMRFAGYEAAEVWLALDVVLDLDDGAIENLLRASGYSEAEILVALAPRLMSKYACLIARSGPKIYFHTEEQFMPSSIDWFMGVTPLVWGAGDDECSGCRLEPGEVDSRSLVETVDEIRSQTAGELDFWFDLPEPEEDPSARRGNLGSATTYVHAVRLRDLGMTDLQFWLFYPYNGPGSMTPASDLFGLGNVCTDLFTGGNNRGNVAPLGEHESDWEVMVLRFDDTTNDLVEIYLSAHGDYIRYPIGALEQEDGQHVVAYSALNGHAFFPHAGQNPHREAYVNFVIGDVELKTLNWANRGQSFSTWTSYEFIALDGLFLDAPWLGFDGVWGETVEFGPTDQDKIQIVYEVADDCLLAVRVIHIPIAALASSSATCAVACAPAAALFGFGYGACLAGCIPGLTVTLTIGANIALEPLLQNFAPDIVDGAFSDQTGTGKPTPAARGEEWRHFRIPNEKPRVIRISDLGDPDAATRQVVVEIPDRVCERKSDKWLLGPSICLDTPEVDRVELGIDGVYTDITDTAQPVVGATAFTYAWSNPGMAGQNAFSMNPRYSNPAGIVFEYSEGTEVRTGTAEPEIEVHLSLDDDTIGEGESALLRGTFELDKLVQREVQRRTAVKTGRVGSERRRDAYEVTVDWGDGGVQTVLSLDRSFSAVHTYVDDGRYTISAGVDDGTLTGGASIKLVVANQAPEIQSVTQSPAFPSVQMAAATVQTSVSFGDQGASDTHDVEWNWGDGSSDDQQTVDSPATASHTYSSPGFYEPAVTVVDNDGALDRSVLDPVVVSEPTGSAGAGSILAPVVTAGDGDADFAFDVSTDSNNQPVVYLEFTVESLVISGVRDPSVVFADHQVRIEGGVSLNGEETAQGGEPYIGRIIAVDGDDDTFEIRVWFTDSNDFEHVVYETDEGQVLASGDVTVDEAGTTSGSGSIHAPVFATVLEEATFGFVARTIAQGQPVVDLRLDIGGLTIRGVHDPTVTVTGDQVVIEGGVTLNGEETAPGGEPYLGRITAVDGPVDDTFEIRIWHVDGSGDDHVDFETAAGQVLQGGEVIVGAP